MISRYSVPDIERIWDLKSKYQYWLKSSSSAAEVLADVLQVDRVLLIKDLEKINITDESVKEICEIEEETKHDLVAFINYVLKNVSEENKRVIHFGLTSSDIIDTSFSLQIITYFTFTFISILDTN